MKIGFVGCGAIGSCYASYLSKVHEVCVLDTYAPVIEAIRKTAFCWMNAFPASGMAKPYPIVPPWPPPIPRRSAWWIC